MTNHHAHSTYSDGQHTLEDNLIEAIRRGVKRYGISDHAPIAEYDFGSMPMADLPKYLAEVDRLRVKYADRLKLWKSLEVDYITGLMSVNSDHIRSADLDYTVASVHYVDRLADGDYWSFQRPNPVFEQGINEIFGGSVRKMVERYFFLVREMLETAPGDVLAHLDRIKKRNVKGKYWDEHATWFVTAVEETLEAIQGAGVILEVNTRGLYKQNLGDTYPSTWIVKRAHERGVPLQVNSDAHQAEHVDGGFDFAYGYLSEIGVEATTVFGDDGWERLAVEEYFAKAD